MPTITRENFNKYYSQIIDKIQSATFVALDCEFSGLNPNNCSLFDSPAERYSKFRKNLNKYHIIQFGLSAFQHDKSNDKFNCTSYDFYLIPSVLFNCGTLLSYDIGSLNFLCRNGFNFNKLIYEGINYLQEGEEEKITKMIQNGPLISDRNYIQDINSYCSRVGEWVAQAEIGSELLLSVDEDQEDSMTNLLHLEIRKKFFNTWTFYEHSKLIKIKKVTLLEKNELQSNKQEDLLIKKKLFDTILGFSKIIKELKNCKKPIVGHNFLLDLMMIYKQFFNFLPKSYKTFKHKIMQAFPHIYDTKHLSFMLQSISKKTFKWNSNSLQDLYKYLKRNRQIVVLNMPVIENQEKEYVKIELYHDAGFDSYCTGYCFIKMAFILSLWNSKQNKITSSTLRDPSWLLNSTARFKNCVNFPRGRVNYIVLDGPDPVGIQPGLLIIKSKQNKQLDFLEVLNKINQITAADIKPLGRYKYLIAIRNKNKVKNVLQHFENSVDLSINEYNFWMHSNLGKSIVTFGILGSTALAAILIQMGLNKIIQNKF